MIVLLEGICVKYGCIMGDTAEKLVVILLCSFPEMTGISVTIHIGTASWMSSVSGKVPTPGLMKIALKLIVIGKYMTLCVLLDCWKSVCVLFSMQ